MGSQKVTMPQPLCFELLPDRFHSSTFATEPNRLMCSCTIPALALNGTDCTKTLVANSGRTMAEATQRNDSSIICAHIADLNYKKSALQNAMGAMAVPRG